MMRAVLLLLFLLAISAAAQPVAAQGGLIRGTVRDATGQPLIGVNVRVEGTGYGAATTEQGFYEIGPLAPARYRLTASLLGYRAQTREVRVGEAPATLDFTLEEQPVEAGEVVVTAARRGQERLAVAQSISLITARDIEQRGNATLDAALRHVPGVQLADNQVSIRGSSGFSYNVGSRVLFLVDGQSMLGPESEGVPFDVLPITQIERIEVVKGPGSALYGGGALGGVINVLTKPFPRQPETTVRVLQGAYLPVRHASWRAGWAPAATPRPFTDVNASHARQVGSRLGFWISTQYRRDAGYVRLSRSERLLTYGKMGFTFSPTTRLSLLGGVTRSKGDAFLYWNGLNDPLNPGSLALGTGSTTGSEDNLTYRFSLLPTFTHTLSPRLFYRVSGRFFGVSLRPLDENGQPRAAIRGTVGVRYGGEVQLGWQASRGILTAGAQADANAVRSSYFGDDPPYLSQPQGAVFAQWEQKVTARLDATLGARYDFYALESDRVEQQLSPKINVGYHLADAWRLRASAGSGFRVPGVTERYVDDSSLFPIVSNPGLRPETSMGYDVGLRGVAGFFTLDAALFWTDFRRLVEPVFVAQPGTQGFQFVNLTRARVRGVEAETQLLWPGDRAVTRLAYQLLDTRDLTASRPLVFRSRHLLQGGIDVDAGVVRVGADYRFSSAPTRVDSDFARFVPDAEVLVATHVLDLRAAFSWRVLTATVLLRNALDYYYAERPAILAPPRSVALRISATF